jgi:hypothetical protein
MDSLVKSTYHAGRGEAGRLSVGFYTSISARNLRLGGKVCSRSWNYDEHFVASVSRSAVR